MGVNSLPKTVTQQRRDCDLNPGLSVPESSTLTTRLPSHPLLDVQRHKYLGLSPRPRSHLSETNFIHWLANWRNLTPSWTRSSPDMSRVTSR